MASSPFHQLFGMLDLLTNNSRELLSSLSPFKFSMLYVIDVSSFSFSLHAMASCLIGSSGFLAFCLGMPVI